MREEVFNRGRLLLEAEHDDKEDFDSYKMARNHYKSCADEENLEELGVKPILEYLDQVIRLIYFNIIRSIMSFIMMIKTGWRLASSGGRQVE